MEGLNMNLFLNSATDYSITDLEGNVYSIEQTKALMESNDTIGCNMALERLISFDFDLDELKEFYDDN